MRDFLVEILFKLKLVIDVLINKLNVNSSSDCHNSEYEDKTKIYNTDSIVGIYDDLKSNEHEEYNWNNTILDLEGEDEKYVEDIISAMIDLDNYIEINDIYTDKEKNDENYSRVDIKALCKDLTIKDIEKVYLIKLIANINLGNNGVEISMSELEILFNNKNRNQINKKLKDLEIAGAIRIVSNSKGNRYYILKHVKSSIYKNQYNCESIKNDTSIISDTVKSKEIINKKDKNLLVNIINKNIKYFK